MKITVRELNNEPDGFVTDWKRLVVFLKSTVQFAVRLLRQNWMAFVVILMIFALFSCAHKGDWEKRVTWEEFDFEDIPGQEEYPDAGAIVLVDEGKMEIGGSGPISLSVFERHRIIKVLNARGRRYANVSILYNSRSQVNKIQARTISPEGDITVLDESDIYDVTFYPNFIFYSDQRAKLFTVPAVANGSLIEYRYKINIWSRTFWHSWNFQDNVPTLLSRFYLAEPSEWEVNYRIYGIDIEPTVQKNPEGFKSIYIWETRDVPALKSEFGMPPLSEVTSRLALAPLGIRTWTDVALWYSDLSEPQMKPGQGVKELASTLTGGVNIEREKLKLIYEWVRDQVRYVAVEIGIGGYKPHQAEKVFLNRYGDCKDMTTLLCSLAREAEIEAYPVLVSTWQNGLPDTSLPSQLQFNHAIAYCPTIGENGIWMDATEKGCPFNQLPWYNQGLPVLMVSKKVKAEILTTPRVPPGSNRTVLDWKVQLYSSGEATVRGEMFLWGAPAAELREDLYYVSSDERCQWLETFLARRCSGAKLDSFQITGLHPVVDPLTISYTFHTATFAVSRSNEMSFMPSSISTFDLPDYFRSPTRMHPVRFNFGSLKELNLTINLPTDLSVVTPVLSDSLISQFGSAFWSWNTSDTVFRVHVSYCIMGNDIDPQHYQDFRDFLDGVREKDLREVILSRVQ